MTRKSIYVAFCNQKGGVGKSAFTTLAASYLHYAGNKNVAVLDCDYPQHSIYAMRERDKGMVTAGDMYKEMMVNQFETINKKAYPILCAKSEDAIEAAGNLVEESPVPIDVVFFDLTGTVNSAGILKSTVSMDYIFCPVTTDRLVMKSSLIYATTLMDFIKQNPAAPLKNIYLFWNMLVKSENRGLYDAYTDIIDKLNLNLLKTEIPFTVKYKREMTMSSRQVFRSTLFPPDKTLLKGSNLDLLVKEVCKIINIQKDDR
jgi:cellulose biosynthesis protein BcsQ